MRIMLILFGLMALWLVLIVVGFLVHGLIWVGVFGIAFFVLTGVMTIVRASNPR